MDKLPISIGILAWRSGQVLVDTLTTYHNNGLFDMVDDVTILFQEFCYQDYEIAQHFGLNVIGMNSNIGIGQEPNRSDNLLLVASFSSFLLFLFLSLLFLTLIYAIYIKILFYYSLLSCTLIV